MPIGKLNNVMLYLSDGVKNTPFSGSFPEWNGPFFLAECFPLGGVSAQNQFTALSRRLAMR